MDNQAIFKALTQRIEELEKRLESVELKRTYQQDVVPQAIKNRHQGEANSYFYNLPPPDGYNEVNGIPKTDGISVPIGTQYLFDGNDYTFGPSGTNFGGRLWMWNNVSGAWVWVTFTASGGT